MAYVIASPRLGKVGDAYEPDEGVNVEALIAGGFISTHKAPKGAKKDTDTSEE